MKNAHKLIPYDTSPICRTKYLQSLATKAFENMLAFDTRKQSWFCIDHRESMEVGENIIDNYVKP
jgi:hypothetical protein